MFIIHKEIKKQISLFTLRDGILILYLTRQFLGHVYMIGGAVIFFEKALETNLRFYNVFEKN